MHTSCIRKKAQPVVGHAGDHIGKFAVRRLLIPLVHALFQKLAVTEAVHNKDGRNGSRRFLHINRLLTVLQTGPAGKGEFFLDIFQIGDDNLIHGFPAL